MDWIKSKLGAPSARLMPNARHFNTTILEPRVFENSFNEGFEAVEDHEEFEEELDDDLEDDFELE